MRQRRECGQCGYECRRQRGTGVGNANAAKETYQIEVLSQLSNFAGTQGGWYGKVLKDKFGLELNITAPNLAGGAAKFATLMASGDLGDIIAFGNDGQEYRDAIKAGLLLDWTKDGLLEKYGKDILATVPKAIEKNKKNFGDGKAVYGVGSEASNMPSGPSDGNTMTYQVDMRWDLYQKLGSPKMTEMEDILPVLKKMQELEAKSDSGKPTYGLSLWGDWDGNYMTLAKQPGRSTVMTFPTASTKARCLRFPRTKRNTKASWMITAITCVC